MAVADRWHTKKPRRVADPETGELVRVEPCRTHKLYPSTDHGTGDRWQVRWRDENGKQCSANRPKKEGKDPDQHAEALDAQIAGQLLAGTYIDPEAGKVTLAKYAQGWRAGLTGEPSTLSNTDDRLAHIIGAPPPVEGRAVRRMGDGTSPIAGAAMSDLAKKPSRIQQWIKGMERNGLSARYIGEISGTLSAIFIAAMDDGVIARNPLRAKSVALPTVDQPKVTPWTREQLAAARASLGRDGAMVDLGTGAGLRASEAFAVGEDDIVFLGRDRHIQVRRQIAVVDGAWVFKLPKRRKMRDVPLSDSLARRLAAHISEYPSVAVTLPWEKPGGKPRTVKLLFLRKDGRPWTGQSFVYWWHKARRAAGVADERENGFHATRHTYASIMLGSGVDIVKLATWLGHSNIKTTLEYYAHFIPDVADTGRKAVDAWLDGQDQPEASARDVPSEGGP